MACIGAKYDGNKRKRTTLELSQKVEILNRLDAGECSLKLMAEFNIGKSTLYDIKSSKEIILQRSYCHNEQGNKKTFHQPKSLTLDAKLYEWFSEKRSEGMSISGPMLIAKAKSLNDELNLNLACKFSCGWLNRFKDRHGIRQLSIAREIKSADCNAATTFSASFASLLKKEGFTHDQIYTGLNWKCLPKKTLAGNEEQSATRFKQNKERLTVILCANTSGTHKINPLVIEKSACPQDFKLLPKEQNEIDGDESTEKNEIVSVDLRKKNEEVHILKETLKIANSENQLCNINSDELVEWVNTGNNGELNNESSLELEDDKTHLQQDNNEMNDCDETWTEIEKAIEKVVSFMERKPAFSYDDCNNARKVKKCLLFKKFQEQKQTEMRKKLSMTLEEKE